MHKMHFIHSTHNYEYIFVAKERRKIEGNIAGPTVKNTLRE